MRNKSLRGLERRDRAKGSGAGVQRSFSKCLLQLIVQPVLRKSCLRVGPRQKLIKQVVGNSWLLPCRRTMSPYFPSRWPSHEIADRLIEKESDQLPKLLLESWIVRQLERLDEVRLQVVLRTDALHATQPENIRNSAKQPRPGASPWSPPTSVDKAFSHNQDPLPN